MKNRWVIFSLLFMLNLANAMEPYTGRIVKDEGAYTAMQGIVHFIGWTIAIIILVWVFKFTKKHMQQDERYKKYMEKQKAEQENKSSETP